MRSNQRRRLTFAVVMMAFSVVSLLASAALAHPKTNIDLDDSPGPLDIVYARTAHSDKATDSFRLKIGTYEAWQSDVLTNLNWIAYLFDLNRKRSGYERRLFITFREGELVGLLYGRGSGSEEFVDGDEPLARLMPRRPDEHSVSVRIRRDMLGRYGKKRIVWLAQSSFETIGQDDQGYPDCNWPEPPPRPYPPIGKCVDETAFLSH